MPSPISANRADRARSGYTRSMDNDDERSIKKKQDSCWTMCLTEISSQLDARAFRWALQVRANTKWRSDGRCLNRAVAARDTSASDQSLNPLQAEVRYVLTGKI